MLSHRVDKHTRKSDHGKSRKSKTREEYYEKIRRGVESIRGNTSGSKLILPVKLREFPTKLDTIRVLAPFINISKKQMSIIKEKEIAEKTETERRFKKIKGTKPKFVIKSILGYMTDDTIMPSTLETSAAILKSFTKSTGVLLYLVNTDIGEIYQYPTNIVSQRHRVNFKIETGTILAAYVAYSKSHVITFDVASDSRFPLGLGWKDSTACAALGIPIKTTDNKVVAVIELTKDVPGDYYEVSDINAGLTLATWIGCTISQSQETIAVQRDLKVFQYLVNLEKCFIDAPVELPTILSDISIFAKDSLGADKSMFYILTKKGDDTLVELYDEVNENGTQTHKKKKRFLLMPKDGSAIWSVISQKELKNLREEQRTTEGYLTGSILMAPILGSDEFGIDVFGILQVTNKKEQNTLFSKDDERVMKIICNYAQHICKMLKVARKKRKNELMHHVLSSTLSFTLVPCEVHGESLPDDFDFPQKFRYIYQFDWYPLDESMLVKLTRMIIKDLAGGLFPDKDLLDKFVLTVKSCYSNKAAVSFQHAFIAMHGVGCIVSKNLYYFSEVENAKDLPPSVTVLPIMCNALKFNEDHGGSQREGMVLGALCHGIKFLNILENPDEHALKGTKNDDDLLPYLTLLFEKFGTFDALCDSDAMEILGEVEKAIRFCYAAKSLRLRHELYDLLFKDSFDWNNASHRDLMKLTVMVVADTVVPYCKHGELTEKHVRKVFKESMAASKDRRASSIEGRSMYSNFSRGLAQSQLEFMTVVCLPWTHILNTFFPNTSKICPLLAEKIRFWRKLKEDAGRLWKPEATVYFKELSFAGRIFGSTEMGDYRNASNMSQSRRTN